MSLDGLTLFTMLACASAGGAIGAVFGGARVASLRARHKRLVEGARITKWHLEMGHSKTAALNVLTDALDKDRAITIAIQEGFPEQAGPWPDPHETPTGDVPDTSSIRVHAVGDNDGAR